MRIEDFWNDNMDEAPKGEIVKETVMIGGRPAVRERHIPAYIIAASKSGRIVGASYWVPRTYFDPVTRKKMLDFEGGRWNMHTREVPPIKWMPMPIHPDALDGEDGQ